MKILSLAFLALLFMAIPSIAEKDQVQIIKENCAEKWGTDYRMQEYCQKKQFEATTEIQELMAKYPESSEERGIINRCATKWKWGEGWDFRMVLYCSEKQIEAYNKVK